MKLSGLKLPVSQKQAMKQVAILLSIVGLTVVATSAFGAGFDIDATGQKAKSTIDKVVEWGVILAGSVGAGVLLYKCVQAYSGNIDWMDVMKFAFIYAVTGAVVTIAAVIFGAFR